MSKSKQHKPTHRMLAPLVKACGRPRFYHAAKDVPKEAIQADGRNLLVVHHPEEDTDADYALVPSSGQTLFCNLLGFLVFPSALPDHVVTDETIILGIHPKHYDS